MNRTALTKPALGIVMGATLALAATAGAGQTSWFSGVFSTGGSGRQVRAALLQVDAAMAAQIKTDAENCGEVGIGASIKTAIGAHSEMAAATPNVESLFDVNDQCFASISQIADLSFAIPSLASILSAAQDAVLKYAQKKVCTAVNKVSGMVAAPINQTINSINRSGLHRHQRNGEQRHQRCDERHRPSAWLFVQARVHRLLHGERQPVRREPNHLHRRLDGNTAALGSTRHGAAAGGSSPPQQRPSRSRAGRRAFSTDRPEALWMPLIQPQ
jgi:hypothetical protein